jgi:CheY-like chemotaxis protein
LNSASIRNHARSWLTAIGDKALPLLTANLSGSDDNRRILSLNILQKTGDDNASWAIRQLINTQPRNPNVRFAAYESLANLPKRKGDYVLAGGLTDSNDNVRLVATKAIAQNLDDSLMAGVRNMVNNPGEVEHIVKAIIDAQAGNLFMGLTDHDNFIQRACAYLGEKAHQSVRDYFVNLLIEKNLTELADTVSRLAKEGEKQARGRVCAVDDSKMVLNIYRSVITDLSYEVILFSRPLDAVSWLRKEKPDIFCTDLNMPGMTGIELIHEVRKMYTKSELPIILVTTQNETRDNTAALEAGVNEIMSKPFDTKMMSTVFDKIMSDA